MPLGSAQTGAAPSATLPSLRRSRARPEPEHRRGPTPARGPEPSGRGKPIARVRSGCASARGGERDGVMTLWPPARLRAVAYFPR